MLLRSSSGGFVYSRFEVGEEEIFLAPIVRSLAPGPSFNTFNTTIIQII